MKDVQCYELFGGIALKNNAFSFFFQLFTYVYSGNTIISEKRGNTVVIFTSEAKPLKESAH